MCVHVKLRDLAGVFHHRALVQAHFGFRCSWYLFLFDVASEEDLNGMWRLRRQNRVDMGKAVNTRGLTLF